MVASPDAAARLCFRLGQVLEERCLQGDRAATWYQEAARRAPRFRAPLTQLRRIYAARESWDLVLQIAEVESALPMAPFERAAFFTQMGEIWHRHMGDGEQGLALYERALEADPEHVAALRGVARIRAGQGQAAEAAAALEKVVERTRGPDCAGPRVELARLYGGPLGQHERAAELYRSALTQDPRCEEALEALCEDAGRSVPVAAPRRAPGAPLRPRHRRHAASRDRPRGRTHRARDPAQSGGCAPLVRPRLRARSPRRPGDPARDGERRASRGEPRRPGALAGARGAGGPRRAARRAAPRERGARAGARRRREVPRSPAPGPAPGARRCAGARSAGASSSGASGAEESLPACSSSRPVRSRIPPGAPRSGAGSPRSAKGPSPTPRARCAPTSGPSMPTPATRPRSQPWCASTATRAASTRSARSSRARGSGRAAGASSSCPWASASCSSSASTTSRPPARPSRPPSPRTAASPVRSRGWSASRSSPATTRR